MSHSKPNFVGTPQTLRANRDAIPQNAPETSDRAFGFCQIIADTQEPPFSKKQLFDTASIPFAKTKSPECLIRSNSSVGTPRY